VNVLKKQALAMWGRTLIPALWMATTQAEEAALPVSGDKVGIVGRADQTEDEDTDDVEQEDTDPDTTNGERDVLGRVVSFCGGHSENLSSQEGVGSADQDRPETGETTQRSRDILVLNESAGVMLHEAGSVILPAGMPETV
jgi:hypothetical protein